MAGSQPFNGYSGSFGQIDKAGHPGLAAIGHPFIDSIVGDADGFSEIGDGAELLHDQAQAASEFLFDANLTSLLQ